MWTHCSRSPSLGINTAIPRDDKEKATTSLKVYQRKADLHESQLQSSTVSTVYMDLKEVMFVLMLTHGGIFYFR